MREHWSHEEVAAVTERLLRLSDSYVDDSLLDIMRERGGDSEVEMYRSWVQPPASAVVPPSTRAGQVSSSSRAAAQSSSEGVILDAPQLVLFVAGRRLDAFNGLLPAWHLSLVLRTANGREIEFEGGPERPGPVRFGRIVAKSRPYRPRPDRESIKVPLISGGLQGFDIRLEEELARINDASTRYHPLGPNSNSVVRNLQIAIGLQPLQPTAIAPGFDQEIAGRTGE